MTRSGFMWFGGKGHLVHKLLPLLPPHEHYVEPFGGGAAVLLAKKPCRGNETYNDVDSGLCDFFKVVSNPMDFEQFYRRVSVLPWSRQIYNESRETWRQTKDRIERVVKWYVVAAQSFSGVFGGSWGSTTNSPFSSRMGPWLNGLKNFPELHARLQRVQIENSSFEDILTRYDGPGYLAYCDPPYVLDTRKGRRVYEYEMSKAQHRVLLGLLRGYKGAVVLSGYNHPLYVRLQEDGWIRKDFEVVAHSAGKTTGSGIKGKGAAKRRVPRTESVWLNPETQRRLRSVKGGFF